MTRSSYLKQTSCFDERYLSSKVARGLLSETQKKQFILSAMKAPLRGGECSADYWKQLCPLISRETAQAFAADGLRHMTSVVKSVFTSANNRTRKLLIGLQDGSEIEACIILKGTTKLRATACISSQIGCRMGCTFCATGTLKLTGNLQCGEIIEQYILCANLMRETGGPFVNRPIRNVVFMGMGEPLDNYWNVVGAMQQLLKTHNLAGHQITLSTVGFSPAKIRQLIQDAPEVSLALSLHAPNQTLRNSLIPSSATVAVETLLDACDAYVSNQNSLSKCKKKRQKLLIEYCMIKDVNDSVQQADELYHLLSRLDCSCIINLIPYNPTTVIAEYNPPSADQVVAFHKRLQDFWHVDAYVRQECGQDVSAACGQLALKRSYRTLKSQTLGAFVIGWVGLNIIGLTQLFKQT